MKNEFMVAIQYLYNFIEYYKEGDSSKIDSLIFELIKEQENKNNYIIAKKLRKLYSQSSSLSKNIKPSLLKSSGIVNNENKLFLIRDSKINSENVVLSYDNQKIYHEILENFHNKDLFKTHNIEYGNKILLYGPPGTGKTMLAYAIAGDLDLPIMHINLDTLISSYLGETGKNIKQIFDQANSGEYIIFLDEFDAIGKQRDDNNELGELKRVVTVLLQHIDMMNPNNMLLASTNHYHLLDLAILRRFDYKLNLEYLDHKGIYNILKLFLSDYNNDINIEKLAILCKGMSGAHIRQLVDKALRKFFLGKFKDLQSALIQEFGMFKLKERKYDLKKQDDRIILTNLIKDLRNIDSKTFTYKNLEDITSIPHSTLNTLNK